MFNVAALFIDPTGPYPKIVRECYDKARDARSYTGGLPIIAHPPCGHWGRMRGRCKAPLAERDLAPFALGLVRRYGGIIEHPEGSSLWREFGLPRPGEGCPLAFTLRIEQWVFGHRAIKPTWLYCHGVKWLHPIPVPTWSRPPAGRPGKMKEGAFSKLSRRQRRLTPERLANWLASGAESAGWGR